MQPIVQKIQYQRNGFANAVYYIHITWLFKESFIEQSTGGLMQAVGLDLYFYGAHKSAAAVGLWFTAVARKTPPQPSE